MEIDAVLLLQDACIEGDLALPQSILRVAFTSGLLREAAPETVQLLEAVLAGLLARRQEGNAQEQLLGADVEDAPAEEPSSPMSEELELRAPGSAVCRHL